MIVKYPEFLSARDALISLHVDIGDDAYAQSALMQAVQVSPNNLERQRELGKIAVRNGKPDIAVKAFEKVLGRGIAGFSLFPEDFF